MSQTTYSQDMGPGVAGMLLSDVQDSYVVSYPASEAITPGRYVEVVNGAVRHPQATTLGKGGVALWQDSREPVVYPANSMVPVLRKGRCYVERLSTASETDLSAANVRHSSTTATDRGTFTFDATSVTAGSEVSAATPTVFVRNTGIAGLAIVELNYP